jgi:hypothetical protein
MMTFATGTRLRVDSDHIFCYPPQTEHDVTSTGGGVLQYVCIVAAAREESGQTLREAGPAERLHNFRLPAQLYRLWARWRLSWPSSNQRHASFYSPLAEQLHPNIWTHGKIPPPEAAMKKVSAASFGASVSAVALCALLLSMQAGAQRVTRQTAKLLVQDWVASPQVNPNDSQESQTFTGKIVKSGAKLVLRDASGKTYQLDDQVKAREFLNKNVSVTGIYDASTRMIHVSAIEPV